MANAQKGEVTLEAGGETYRLQYTTNAMCELEDAAGKTINDLVAELGDEANPPGIKSMRVLLWAALVEHQEAITVKETGKIIDAIGIASVGSLIGESFKAAFPDGDEGEGKSKASKE